MGLKGAGSLLQGYLAVITSMLIWGSVGVFARYAAQPPLVSVMFRVLFGAAALALLLAVQRRQRASSLTQGQWVIVGLSGVALALNWTFFFRALSLTTVSNAVLSYYAAPVMVALASPFAIGERLEGRTLVATGLAFLGVAAMLYQPGAGLSRTDLLGIGAGLTAALFYTLVTLSTRWVGAISATRLVLAQCTVASAILVPVVWFGQGAAGFRIPAPALAILAVIGLVHTAFALILYYYGLRVVKVQHVGVLAYLDPVSAVLFALLFLGEVPAPNSLVGGAMVLGSSALLWRRS